MSRKMQYPIGIAKVLLLGIGAIFFVLCVSNMIQSDVRFNPGLSIEIIAWHVLMAIGCFVAAVATLAVFLKLSWDIRHEPINDVYQGDYNYRSCCKHCGQKIWKSRGGYRIESLHNARPWIGEVFCKKGGEKNAS